YTGMTEWSSWFNIDHPGGSGDYEHLEAIRFYYRDRVCARPFAIEARTTEWVPPEETGELVHSTPEKGFWCINKQQPEGKICSNYHVRFLCPLEKKKREDERVQEYWSHWSAWSSCSATACGAAGIQARQRSCLSTKQADPPKAPKCVGQAIERKECITRPCPECQQVCSMGRVNEDCSSCVCDGHVLLGTVQTLEGTSLINARVAMEDRPWVTLTKTDERGQFRIQGICSNSKVNVTIALEKFASSTVQALSNGTETSMVRAIMKKAEKPYIVKHPEAKVRFEDQRVIFCCKAVGNPMPNKYYWYHNGTLLDRQLYKYDDNLILRNLKPWQTGEYYCKASNDIGTIRSSPAVLHVVATEQESCNPKPKEYLIKLPEDCFQTATNSLYYNVGKCPNTKCVGKLDFDLRCKDKMEYCCGIKQMKKQEIECKGYTLPVKVVAECGCEKCIQPKILVRGRGAFTVQVPPDTERLVIKFVDKLQKFIDTIKVFPFDQRGGAVYHDVKVMRKQEPVDIDATKTNTIVLGEIPGEDPIGEIVIPPYSFLRSNGEIYNGTVQASVTFLDPRDITTASVASSDLNFVNNEGEILPLRTYGMFSVDFREESSKEVLDAGRVEVYMDTEQIKMPEHVEKMQLWSLNPDTGIWEKESDFHVEKSKRNKREERTFLIGNMEIKERRLFNLDVPENRRCYVKVRAYMNEKFLPSEQLEGIVVNLINLEPMPGYSSNPRAWGRFDSVITGPNGACLPAFCDAQRPDAYTAYVTATLGGEELEAAASSPKLNPNVIGVSQPYLDKLGYQRTDHDDPLFKKTAFKINLAKPNLNNIEETNGPIYAYQNVKDCEDAPVSANHFRFYRIEGDKYEYNVVPFQENDLTSWTGDYLSWWPNPQEFRACYIKVRINGPQEVMVRSRNTGGTHPQTRGQLYGIRDARSVRDMKISGSSAACVEFKCGGMLFDQNLVDRTKISVIPQGSCRRVGINNLLKEYLIRHPPLAENNDTSAFNMIAPVDPLGHNYGIYTVTDQNPRLAKEIAIGRCFDGTSDGFSREMKSDSGITLTFSCLERAVTRESLFQRLQASPVETLA
uniref:Cartilage intermediate layer protein 2 n=1 Tax=Latimeria chalumnae TaxID=7897 RepID=H3A298_LATCH